MAKQKQSLDSGIGKIKIRLVEFEVEGGDATLQESLKSISAALGRAHSSPLRAPKYIPGMSHEPGGEAEAEDAEQAEDVDESELIDVVAKKPSIPRKAKVVAYDVITDLRFDDVQPTLKDFASEKKPPSDLARYLVIAYWFKYHKKSPEITPRHFFTAYKLLGWKVPRDPATPMRELLASRDQRLSKGSGPSSCVINQVGENFVEKVAAE